MAIPDWTDAGTLLLPVEPVDWPPPAHGLELDGIHFAPKHELHVTIIGNGLGRELRARSGGRGGAIHDAIAARCWDFRRTHRTLLLRKPFVADARARVAHSVIERIELPAMAPFHRDLGRLLGRQLPVPPPHVTLYTAGRAKGIGVPSEACLRALAVRELSHT